MRILFRAEDRRTSAENFRVSLQFAVNFQSDYRFILQFNHLKIFIAAKFIALAPNRQRNKKFPAVYLSTGNIFSTVAIEFLVSVKQSWTFSGPVKTIALLFFVDFFTYLSEFLFVGLRFLHEVIWNGFTKNIRNRVIGGQVQSPCQGRQSPVRFVCHTDKHH